MTCPYLEYRISSGDGPAFDTERPYCTVAARFVQPMRADICNDRYDLVHDRDCEIYRAHGNPSNSRVETESENAEDE